MNNNDVIIELVAREDDEAQRKEWLIGELAIATAKKDYSSMENLATELYESYGWNGTPYYTH